MSADHCPEHVDRLDLCHQCQGLTVTRMTRLTGVTDFKLWGPGGELLVAGGPATVYTGPVEPCPNTPALEEGAPGDV
ncbi:hypothetical protein ABTY98_41560 [Streptomyces sp. NPDC096040]|uniref:hypothetical protein n=1 Tax=Streptomyces sp. NPDC096040 TaxID=3155541 RepID=UPI003322CCC5